MRKGGPTYLGRVLPDLIQDHNLSLGVLKHQLNLQLGQEVKLAYRRAGCVNLNINSPLYLLNMTVDGCGDIFRVCVTLWRIGQVLLLCW